MSIEVNDTDHAEVRYQLSPTTTIMSGVHATVTSEIDEEKERRIPRSVLSTLYMGIEMGPEFDGRVNKHARDFGFIYTPDSKDPNKVIMTNRNLNNGVIYEAKLRHEGEGWNAHRVIFEGVTTREMSEA